MNSSQQNLLSDDHPSRWNQESNLSFGSSYDPANLLNLVDEPMYMDQTESSVFSPRFSSVMYMHDMISIQGNNDDHASRNATVEPPRRSNTEAMENQNLNTISSANPVSRENESNHMDYDQANVFNLGAPLDMVLQGWNTQARTNAFPDRNTNPNIIDMEYGSPHDPPLMENSFHDQAILEEELKSMDQPREISPYLRSHSSGIFDMNSNSNTEEDNVFRNARVEYSGFQEDHVFRNARVEDSNFEPNREAINNNPNETDLLEFWGSTFVDIKNPENVGEIEKRVSVPHLLHSQSWKIVVVIVNLMLYVYHVIPFSKAPTIIDENGTILSEIHTLLRYLCRKYKAPDHWYPGVPLSAKAEIYLDRHMPNIREIYNFLIASITPIFPKGLLDSYYLEEVRKVVTRSLKLIGNVWRKENRFVGGKEISIADISAAAQIIGLITFKWKFKEYPKMKEWLEKVKGIAEMKKAHEGIYQIAKDLEQGRTPFPKF